MQFVLGLLFREASGGPAVPHPRASSGERRRRPEAATGPPLCHPTPRQQKAFSKHDHQKGPKEMERERVGAGEPFPCTAAASAGTGAAEQERWEGAVD